jgi:hypothetical protein
MDTLRPSCGQPNRPSVVSRDSQGRHRARHAEKPVAEITRGRRAIDRRSRPQRWRAAVDELLALQAAYADWLAALPDSLRESPTAAALETIVDLDLTALAECELPADTAGIKKPAETGRPKT